MHFHCIMDPENIASILKDAITASTAKIQSESKHTNVFVLPPELLEGILKNDPSKVNKTSSLPSKSKETKKAKKNKSPSLENAKSITLPVDRPKRTSNRQRATNKSPKITLSETSSENTPTGLTSEEKSHEQATFLDNYEISEAFTSTENIAVQNESIGGKDGICTESELADLYNAETILDTILDTVQENIKISHEDEICPKIEVSDEPLNTSKIEQNSIPISEKVEAKYIECNQELQNCSNNETTNRDIETDNLTIIADIETLKKVDCKTEIIDDLENCSYNKTMENVIERDDLTSIAGIGTLEEVDCKTEVIDHISQNSGSMISKVDASQKISNKEISAEVELNNEGTEDITIIEEIYIVEEIEMVESEDDNMYTENNETNKLEVENIKVEKDSLLETIDFSEPIEDPSNIISQSTSKKVPIIFKPIVEQKRPNTTKVYANKKKKKIQVQINKTEDQTLLCESHILKEFQKEVYFETNYNFDCYGSTNTFVTETPVSNPCEDLECREKSNLELEYNSDHNSLSEAAPLENQCHETKVLEQEQVHFKLETNCLIDEDISYTKLLETYNQDLYLELREKSETVCELENTSSNNTDTNLADVIVKNKQKHMETNGEIKSTEIDFCIEIKQNEETISALEKTDFKESSLNFVDEAINNIQDQMETNDEIENKEVDSCIELKQKEETISVLKNTDVGETSLNFLDESIENTQGRLETEGEIERIKVDFCTELEQNKETTSVLEKIDNKEIVDELVENTYDLQETREEIESTHSFGKTSDTPKKFDDQTEDLKVKVYNTRTRKKSANTVINDKSSVKTVKTVQKEPKTTSDSTDNTSLNDSLKNSSESKVNNLQEDNTDNFSFKSETNISCKSHGSDKSRDNWKNGEECSIKSLRQLRNRTKVIPIDLFNFNKLTNFLSKESLYSQNGGKDDLAVKNNTEVSNRTRSTSLNCETLSNRARKISRKPVSVDNCLLNENKINTLRRRSVVPENEIKVEPIVEDSGIKETDKTTNDEKRPTKVEQRMKPENNLNDSLLKMAINKKRSSLKSKKDIDEKIVKEKSSRSSQVKDDLSVTVDVDRRDTESNEIDRNPKITDTTASSEDTVENNDVQMEFPETDGNEVLLRNNEDRKPNCNLEESHCEMNISIGKLLENVFKVKTENIIPVKKVRRGRSAKFISSDELTAESITKVPDMNNCQDTDVLHAKNNLINHTENVSATNIEKNENTKLLEVGYNETSDSGTSNRQVENALKNSAIKIKTENVTPVKRGRRGRSLKYVSTDEITTKNINAVDLHQSESESESVDCTKFVATAVPADDASNAKRQVENAMDECTSTIKTEKVTPFKRGRRGRSLKSIISNGVHEKNVESVFNNQQSDRAAVSNGCREVIGTVNPVATSNVEHQVGNALVKDTLKIKTEKITPVRRGRRGRSLNTMHTNEMTAEDTERFFESHLSKSTNESIDCEKIIAEADPPNASNAECNADTALVKETLKITPVRKGGRGKSSKFIISDTHTTGHADIASDISRSENTTELIDCEKPVAAVKSVGTSNAKYQVENAIEENCLEIKTGKVTAARRGRLGRSSKSIPSDEIISEHTENVDNCHQLENKPALISCKELLETEDLVDPPIAGCHVESDSSKGRKCIQGMRLQSVPSNEITAENIESIIDSHQSESRANSIDGGELIAKANPVDLSNAEYKVDNAVYESGSEIKPEKVTPIEREPDSVFGGPQSESSVGLIDCEKLVATTNSVDTVKAESQLDNVSGLVSSKIKIEKITPIRRGRKGRSSTSTPSNQISMENVENVVDSRQSENTTESIDCGEIIATGDPVETSNAKHLVDNALEQDIFKIKSEKMTSVRRGVQRRSSKLLISDEISAGNSDSPSDSPLLESTTESIDWERPVATEKSVDDLNAEYEVNNVPEEDISKIKTEKITPVRRGKKCRLSSFISSTTAKTEKTKDDVDINKNSHELASADSLDGDEAKVNDFATTSDEKDENHLILPINNSEQTLECSSIDQSVASLSVEIEVETGKLLPLKRGRKASRLKRKPSINQKLEEHNEVDYTITDSTIEDYVAPSSNVQKDTGDKNTSSDMNEKSESDITELLEVKIETVCPENNAKLQLSKTSSTKKKTGKRGRDAKLSEFKDTVEEKETPADDCVVPLTENNAEAEEDNDTPFKDANDYPKSIDIHMEVDSTTEDSNINYDDSSENIGINNKINEEPEKSTSGSSRRSGRRVKQKIPSSDSFDIQTSSQNNIEKALPSSRRSSKMSTRRITIDNGDKAKDEDSSNFKVSNSRRSARHLKTKVDYLAPDEDVDVFDSEARAGQQISSENTPKKRRGRPSKAEMLKSSASAVEKVEESPQEFTKSDINLETSAKIDIDDSDTPLADRNDTLTKRRIRTAKRTDINEDISEEGLKPGVEEKSLTTESDDTNDFYDNHFSVGLEDEEVIEDTKPGRGRKRRYVLTGYKARKRGRPKRGEVESNDDEDYTPHHSYVPHPPKIQEKPKNIIEKKMVQCGKCEKDIAKPHWSSHNLYSHNDMSWIVGTVKPDFESDQKLLIRVLTVALKKKKKKGLVCEACREVKRSVVGFTSHIMFCGKTEAEMALLLVTCETCGGKFKPSSMEYHERQHRLDLVKKKKEQDKAETIADVFEPRSKRKAAEKAVSKISEFTALVKDEDGFSSTKKMKLSSPHMKKFIQKPQATKRISSITIAKWKKELENKQDAACTQLGCQFTCKSLEEMREHYSSCNFTATENYVCKICNYQTASEDEIIKHASEKHASEDLDINATVSGSEAPSDDDDYSEADEDSSNQGPSGSGKKFVYKEASDVENKLFKFVFENTFCLSIQNKTPLSAFQWTLEFEMKNFKFKLFENFLPNAFTLLEEENAKNYLPQIESSMPVRFTKKDGVSNSSEWKNWDRFEACRVDDSPTFFVGGPIWAMAWAPTPSYLATSSDLSQFLAISTHPTMDNEYAVGKSYSGKNIIQIWKLGKLNNRILSESDPELSYAIAHDGGTVWSLEWCPSGCYQHEDFPILNGDNHFNRLGLLAAGCSDGCVRIYSLIFPDDLHRPDKNQYPIYNTEIAAQLILNTKVYERKSESWQVFRICWYREANHNVVVAGFSNGYVAFWDLTTNSPMLKYQVGNTTFFRPYKQFFAHHHAVTMLKLVPGGNQRYLATASLDRLFKFWDLEDTTKPKKTFKKSYVTDGSWFNNWCCAVVAHDEALCMGHNTSVCIALRDYTYKYYNLLPSNSTTFAVDTSDFANGVATGNVAGELLALFPQQLMYIREMERTLNSKRSFSVISTVELVDFKALPDDNLPAKKDKKPKKINPYQDPAYFQPSTYEDSKDRFGIQFNNNMSVFQANSKKSRKPQKKQSLTCDHLEKNPIEQYPLKSINKLAWNPNASSFLWLAAGYQSGFVRLISFKSAASTLEWNKLLQSHINALKTDE